MQVILLKGKQGTAKTSLWGVALKSHFARKGPVVLIDHDQFSEDEIREHVDAALLADATLIVVTSLDSMPIERLRPTYTLTVECDANQPGSTSCSGHFSRQPYARTFTRCPCGACEPISLYQAPQPEIPPQAPPRRRSAILRVFSQLTS